jgi:hypothetical protein
MKMLLLAVTALTLCLGTARANSGYQEELAVVSVPAMPASDIVSSPAPSATGTNFAQLDTHVRMVPISSGMVLALIALFVLAVRIMSVNHARAMADQERDSYHAKAEMFRSLHEKR